MTKQALMKKLFAAQEPVSLFIEDLSYTRLRRANLRGSSFDACSFIGADFCEVNLSHASLRGSNLAFANLSFSCLRGADLRATNLYMANLYMADLREADLTDSNIAFALLLGTSLAGARMKLGRCLGLVAWLPHLDFPVIAYLAEQKNGLVLPCMEIGHRAHTLTEWEHIWRNPERGSVHEKEREFFCQARPYMSAIIEDLERAEGKRR